MPDTTVTTYEVQPHLGRHQALDPRSLAYVPLYDGRPLRPTAWEPRLPALDQRNLITQGIRTSTDYGLPTDLDALGSCTGNAATTLLSVLLTPERATAAGLNLTDPAAAQHYAIGLYADATTRDQWHTYTWPTQDVGSSGLGVTQAMHDRGLITQYVHATTTEQLCALLQTGPVLMGMPWHAAFSDPGTRGFIDSNPAWATSPLEGGHEVCITALEDVAHTATGALDPDRTVLRFRNSWSAGWGDHGDGLMHLTTYLALRDQIDLIQPRLDGDTP
ncbi:hypothetical protein ACF06X_33385 [Streptomyces sp. NPDC015346]|uniref:hypothetical protein n=1 Tax=Streptomyces sp. NPDC015346 TaxID=3364954 RepID=UPI0036FBAD25